MSFITKTHLSRRTFLHGVGVTHGAAAAGVDDPGGDRLRPDGRAATHAVRRDLLPARRDHAEVDAGHGRRRLRAHARSCSRSSRSTTRSTSSAICGTRSRTAAAPRPTTIARPPHS